MCTYMGAMRAGLFVAGLAMLRLPITTQHALGNKASPLPVRQSSPASLLNLGLLCPYWLRCPDHSSLTHLHPCCALLPRSALLLTCSLSHLAEPVKPGDGVRGGQGRGQRGCRCRAAGLCARPAGGQPEDQGRRVAAVPGLGVPVRGCQLLPPLQPKRGCSAAAARPRVAAPAYTKCV